MPAGIATNVLGLDSSGNPVLVNALDLRRFTAAASLRQIANRSYGSFHGMSNTFTSSMCRMWEINFEPVSALDLTIGAWAMNAGVETNLGADLTVAASIEYPAGTFTQVTWNGGTVLRTIPDGTTETSDLLQLGFTIPAFTKYWVRIYMANAVAMPFQSWLLAADLARGDRFTFNGTNQTMSGTVTDTASGVYMSFPSAIRAYSNRQVWGAFGDSTIAGVNDQSWDASGGQGYVGRALAKWGPWINFGVGGDRMQYFSTNSTKRRAVASLAGMTRAIQGFGINDFNNGRTAANVATDRETIRSLLGVPMFDMTTMPITTSSNGFATAAGQTNWNSTFNTQRVSYNNALRAGVATSLGLIDSAMMLETSTSYEHRPVKDGGVWLPRFVGDGTHPNSDGYERIAEEMETILQLMAV